MNWFTKSRAARTQKQLPAAVLESAAATSALFQEAPGHELARLDQLGTVLDVPAGTRVVRQDGLGSQCVVVLDGHLAVKRDGEVIADITPGYFGGEMSMLHHERCNADVVASDDAVVYAMGRGDFQTLMATCPQIRGHVRATAGIRDEF